MSNDSFYQGPNQVHPEKESAVGSRNSLHRDGRNEYSESKLLIDEEVDKILNHVSAKLPPEVLEKIHVGGTVKDILHNYFNQSFHNMYNRYLVTVEDELSKKFRRMIDTEEVQGLNKHTAKEMTTLLDQLAGSAKFNNENLERSIVSIYSQLQGHLQKGVHDLQKKTDLILQEKGDVGGLINVDHTFSIVQCHIADNAQKPETVTDVSLVINILESELLSPIFHFQATTESIIKDVISGHILERVENEITDLNKKLVAESHEEMNSEEELFESFRRLENYVDFENTPTSPQYSYITKEFFEKIEGIGSEIPQDDDFDPLNIRENLQNIVDDGKLRTKGFNKAVNTLTNYLDDSQLGYQHMENFKNARKVTISEYSEKNSSDLPDEHYSVNLSFYDEEQVQSLKDAYSKQISEFNQEVDTIWDVYNVLRKKHQAKENKFDFLALSAAYKDGPPPQPTFMDKLMSKIKRKKGLIPIPADVEEETRLDERGILKHKLSHSNDPNVYIASQKRFIQAELNLLGNKIKEVFEYDTANERKLLDERLNFLTAKFDEFSSVYNPYNVRAGLFLNLTLSTIKKKESTSRRWVKF